MGHLTLMIYDRYFRVKKQPRMQRGLAIKESPYSPYAIGAARFALYGRGGFFAGAPIVVDAHNSVRQIGTWHCLRTWSGWRELNGCCFNSQDTAAKILECLGGMIGFF